MCPLAQTALSSLFNRKCKLAQNKETFEDQNICYSTRLNNLHYLLSKTREELFYILPTNIPLPAVKESAVLFENTSITTTRKEPPAGTRISICGPAACSVGGTCNYRWWKNKFALWILAIKGIDSSKYCFFVYLTPVGSHVSSHLGSSARVGLPLLNIHLIFKLKQKKTFPFLIFSIKKKKIYGRNLI